MSGDPTYSPDGFELQADVSNEVLVREFLAIHPDASEEHAFKLLLRAKRKLDYYYPTEGGESLPTTNSTCK